MINDFRFAFRQLRKSPGFTFVAILTLALGIGANTAIFSVIYAVLLRPLPYPEADRLMIVTETVRSMPRSRFRFRTISIGKATTPFSKRSPFRAANRYNLSGLEGRAPEQVSGALVTANFFKVIGLNPQQGRVFTEEEDRVGGPLLAVISDRLWDRIFSPRSQRPGTDRELWQPALHHHWDHAAADVFSADGGRLVPAHAADRQSSLADAR